jgi:hypothetical protein
LGGAGKRGPKGRGLLCIWAVGCVEGFGYDIGTCVIEIVIFRSPKENQVFFCLCFDVIVMRWVGSRTGSGVKMESFLPTVLPSPLH